MVIKYNNKIVIKLIKKNKKSDGKKKLLLK